MNADTWIRYRHDEKDTYKSYAKLEGTETASSVEIKDRYGVTVDSSSVASDGLVSVTISDGGFGRLIAMVTTSTGRIIAVPMQWRKAYRNSADGYSHYWRY